LVEDATRTGRSTTSAAHDACACLLLQREGGMTPLEYFALSLFALAAAVWLLGPSAPP
jgi:hypothetical protein